MGICHQTVIFFCYDDSTCETGGIYMEVLTVRNLTKTYGKGDTAVTALKNVSFQVNKGEFIAIIGSSGSGKSTLMNLIGGIDRPSSGTVTIDGKDIYSLDESQRAIFRRRNIGMVFQNYAIFPNMTVRDNVAFGLKNRKIEKEKIKKEISENEKIIKKYDILHLDEYYIFVHEYGHYIDILNKTKDFKSFITILKIATFWLIIIICILMFGNLFLSSLHDFFIFSLILETILITIDIFITMKLEISANVVAIKIMQKQMEVKLKPRIFYLLSTISQVIDRFFFLLMVLLIYIVFH